MRVRCPNVIELGLPNGLTAEFLSLYFPDGSNKKGSHPADFRRLVGPFF